MGVEGDDRAFRLALAPGDDVVDPFLVGGDLDLVARRPQPLCRVSANLDRRARRVRARDRDQVGEDGDEVFFS
jgi:hypothetical protein